MRYVKFKNWMFWSLPGYPLYLRAERKEDKSMLLTFLYRMQGKNSKPRVEATTFLSTDSPKNYPLLKWTAKYVYFTGVVRKDSCFSEFLYNWFQYSCSGDVQSQRHYKRLSVYIQTIYCNFQ